MKLSSTEIQKIKDVLIGAKVSQGYMRQYNHERVITHSGKITGFELRTRAQKTCWTVVFDFGDAPFYDFARTVRGGETYRTSSKRVKDLASAYVQAVTKDDAIFHRYLEDLDVKFDIEKIDVNVDEVGWLRKHVTGIYARFPSKYEKAFKKAFPGAPYTVDDRTWNYSFGMYFDEIDDIPQALLSLKNKAGNAVDLEAKRLSNVSYIWRLLKDYPEFTFGKRQLC